MMIPLQLKILNTKDYYKYLKENSFFIKELNRSSKNMNKFIEYIKDKYQLRINDKITNVLDNIDMVNNILKVLK